MQYLFPHEFLHTEKDYKIKFKDPSTGDDVEDTIDLTQLEAREFDFDKCERGVGIFDYELPHSKRKIHQSYSHTQTNKLLMQS